MERLRPALRTFRDERGRELFDIPDGPLPELTTPAPPRFLPEFDNLLLGHHDRTRVIAAEHRYIIDRGTFLLDGLVAGVWAIAEDETSARLAISSFAPLSKSQRQALGEEGERLLGFGAADASARSVAFAVAPPRSFWGWR
jgi:hypothetical protein